MATEVGKPGTNFKQVSPEHKKKLGPLIKHYRKYEHPFTQCVTDNIKRFGKERAERVCAVLKDLMKRTTKWRNGGDHKKDLAQGEFDMGGYLLSLEVARAEIEDIKLSQTEITGCLLLLEQLTLQGDSIEREMEEFDPEAYALSLHLARERIKQERSLNLAIEFDPKKHPRGLKGRFREVLNNLKPGETANLPDGVHVERTDGKGKGKFRVGGADQPSSSFDTPENAAGGALARSLGHEHDDAVGGKKKIEATANTAGPITDALDPQVSDDRQKLLDMTDEDAQDSIMDMDEEEVLRELRNQEGEAERKGEQTPYIDDELAVLLEDNEDETADAEARKKLDAGDVAGAKQVLIDAEDGDPEGTADDAMARITSEARSINEPWTQESIARIQQTKNENPEVSATELLAMWDTDKDLGAEGAAEDPAAGLEPEVDWDVYGDRDTAVEEAVNWMEAELDAISDNQPRNQTPADAINDYNQVAGQIGVEQMGIGEATNRGIQLPDGTEVWIDPDTGEVKVEDPPSAAGTEPDPNAPAAPGSEPPGKDAGPAEGQSPTDVTDVGDDVQKAADLLAEGKKVQMDQPRSVSVLLEELAKRVQEMRDKGEKAPDFDLCKVTVPGTNLFCAESKGIPRVKMPQLKGKPEAGSKGDMLEKDDKGEVDLAQAFRIAIMDRGTNIEDVEEKASYLRASQIELNGGKVAGMTKAMAEGKIPDARLFISKDNYIVDGHHRWAAKIGIDVGDNQLGDVDMPIARIDMGIIELLDEANKFASEWGIPQAGV